MKMISDILKAVVAYGSTFKLLGQLKLWKYFAVPMAISFFTAVAIGFAVWGFADNVGRFFSNLWVWEWGAESVAMLSIFIGGLLIIAVGLVLYKHIIMAFSAPFMSPVSEKIERHLFGTVHLHRKTSFFEQLLRGLRMNFRNLLRELLLTAPIVLIGFIPVVGIVSSFLLFLVQSYYAGFGNMDYTLERHFGYSESVRFVKKNRGTAIGNGLVFMLVLLLPLLGIILVLPLSVTAATTETLRLLEIRGQNQNNIEKIK